MLHQTFASQKKTKLRDLSNQATPRAKSSRTHSENFESRATAAVSIEELHHLFVVCGPCSFSRENALARSVHKLSGPLSTVRGDKLSLRNQRARLSQNSARRGIPPVLPLRGDENLSSGLDRTSTPFIPREGSVVSDQRGEFLFDGVGLLATVNEQRNNKVQDTHVPFMTKLSCGSLSVTKV